MRMKRMITGLVSASLLGLAPLALVAAPAQAASYTPTIQLESYYKQLEHGGGRKTFFSGAVTYTDATGQSRSVSGGTAVLQQSTSKNPAWVNVGVDEYPGYLFFEDIPVRTNSKFRVVYSGGTSGADTFLATTSGEIKVKVVRKVTTNAGATKKRGTKVRVKISPNFKKKKVKILRSNKENGKYKKFRTVRTNKKGVFTTRLPAPGRVGPRIYFKFVITGDKHYARRTYGPVYTFKGYFRSAD